jgi:putative FmdB family regulatory protein
MPTYEYRCTACEHRFEQVQKMSDPPRKRCPKCGKKVERLIGAGAGLLFKGSGFHITDYRSSEYQAKAKAEASGARESASAPKETPKESPKEAAKENPKSSGRDAGSGSGKGGKAAEGSK